MYKKGIFINNKQKDGCQFYLEFHLDVSKRFEFLQYSSPVSLKPISARLSAGCLFYYTRLYSYVTKALFENTFIDYTRAGFCRHNKSSPLSHHPVNLFLSFYPVCNIFLSVDFIVTKKILFSESVAPIKVNENTRQSFFIAV